MSNTNSGFTSFASTDYNKNNQKAEWTIDNNDQTYMINIAATYELPIGKGKQFLSDKGLLTNIVGGWQISPLLQYATGTPIFSGTGGSVYAPGDPLGNGCAPCNRVNIVSGTQQEFSYNNVYKGLPVLTAAAFTAPGFMGAGHGASRSLDSQPVEYERKRFCVEKVLLRHGEDSGRVAILVFQCAQPCGVRQS